MPTPCDFSSPMTRKSRSTSLSLSEAVGSSMIRMRASAPRARAISTSCCSGIDSESDLRFRVDLRADFFEQLCRSSRADGPSECGASRRRLEPDRDVLGDREVRKEGRLLVNRGDSQVARAGPDRDRSTERPWTSIRPSSGRWAPVITLISVDLPAPFSPTRAWTSPARRSNETPFKACTPANALLIPVNSSSVATSDSWPRVTN